MRREQVQKANSIMYVLKHHPGLTAQYSGPELNLLLSTAQDPFSKFRERHVTE